MNGRRPIFIAGMTAVDAAKEGEPRGRSCSGGTSTMVRERENEKELLCLVGAWHASFIGFSLKML